MFGEDSVGGEEGRSEEGDVVIIYRPINGLKKAYDGLMVRRERTKGVILKKM